METRTYVFKSSGHFMGTYRQEGEEIDLHGKQARYAVMAGRLALKEGQDDPTPKPARPEPKARIASAPKPHKSRTVSERVELGTD